MAVRDIKSDFTKNKLITNKSSAMYQYQSIFDSNFNNHYRCLFDVLRQSKERYNIDLENLPEGIDIIEEFNTSMSQYKLLQEQFIQTIQKGHIYDLSNIFKDIFKIIIIILICLFLNSVSAPSFFIVLGAIVDFIIAYDLLKRCLDYDGTYKELQQLYVEIDEFDTKISTPIYKLNNLAVNIWQKNLKKH